MIITSVVTGTYNRLPHLRSMIHSVRRSVGLGVGYEIIIVDGGSTDGTIAWCKGQPDIRLIEQGKLLGAVKAFNAGAEAAIGKYVILANDDIEFLGDSILLATVYMEDHPLTGIGCFYQDRHTKDFTLDRMPVIINGKQSYAIFGQICIVRKWLGDLVGWWGDYLYTYGGDNELSCNVYELGYKIEGIEGARVHDKVLADALREVNRSTREKAEASPWREKWTHPDGKVGPIVVSEPLVFAEEKKLLRVLYCPLYERRYADRQKKTKFGLRLALAERYFCLEIDYTLNNTWLNTYAEIFKPDVFLIQVQDHLKLSKDNLVKFKAKFPNAIFISWNGDYHKENLYHPEYMALLAEFDLATLATTDVRHEYYKHDIHLQYWQIGYETYDRLPDPEIVYDAVFLGSCYSAWRERLGMTLRSITDRRIGIFGVWARSHIPIKEDGSTIYDFSAGDKLYRSSLLGLGDQQWPEAEGYVSNRLFQAMFTGTCFLQQRFKRMEELLGLVDGENIVCWDTLEELPDLIRKWSSPEMADERRRIGEAGRKLMIEKHSFRCRVEELSKWIKEIRDLKLFSTNKEDLAL